MPPKQKKQPRNSYYFYMVQRKEELEYKGFPGGMKDVANAVGQEWAAMSVEQKLPYEEMARKAKDEGKSDLTNKFTSTGESYAQVQKRMQDDKQSSDEQESYVTELGMGPGALDRVFIVVKTVHCVEQIIERNQRIYWPLEVGMAAFTLREGLKSIYWTLVDTQKTPVGYASAAKECSEETGLPEPGAAVMQEYRDYNKIMKHIQGFIRNWTKQGYRNGSVVFALDQETEHARGCFKWLATHVDEDKRREHQLFLDSLKFYKLPKLILRLASYANQLDPNYYNVLVQHKLEHSAANIVKKGCYDYKDEITCKFHVGEKASLKMYTCCRNVVLRRMYLMFEEFLPAFGLEKTDRHDMNKLKEAQQAKAKASVSRSAATAPVDKVVLEEPSLSPPIRGPGPAPVGVAGAPWGATRRESAMSDDDDPSPQPQSTYKRLSPEPQFAPVAAGYVPWGRSAPAPEASFVDDDFPALGAGLPQSRKGPMGRGRGAAGRQDHGLDYDRRDADSYY